MKTEKNILFAFLLNLSFAIFELFGGVFTGSVAILSDALHDIGDAASIGTAFFLEKRSKKPPDEKYSYGYIRYSVLGGVITTLILVIGSFTVIYNAVLRIIRPTEIDCSGMIVFAVVGVCVNFFAAILTRKGDSLNQRAVNLHMLEDVLGWLVVLIGAVVMKFTDLYMIDPLMSVCVAAFILINAVRGLKEALALFLEKTPAGIRIDALAEHIREIEGVLDVHHIHVWSMDGHQSYATMHVVVRDGIQDIKSKIRDELKEHGVCHVTLELEREGEECHEKDCHVAHESVAQGHHHHHHHHHKARL